MKALCRLTLLLAVVVPRALAGTTMGGRDGEVRGVSVLPATGKVEVVIDVLGAAVVQDFTLSNPARLVIDLQGTRLTGAVALYDGQNRGGVRNVDPPKRCEWLVGEPAPADAGGVEMPHDRGNRVNGRN